MSKKQSAVVRAFAVVMNEDVKWFEAYGEAKKFALDLAEQGYPCTVLQALGEATPAKATYNTLTVVK